MTGRHGDTEKLYWPAERIRGGGEGEGEDQGRIKSARPAPREIQPAKRRSARILF